MTSIPTNFARVPNRLATSLTRQGLSSANMDLLRSQTQLATSKRVARPSDDPVAAALINVLESRLATTDQRARNLQHADSVLGQLDTALGHITDSAQGAKEVALSQIGVGSDAQTRASQAVVISSLIDTVYNSLNRDYAGIHFFGGKRTGEAPVSSFFGGYRYQGEGAGLYTDMGPGLGFPITIGADRAIGAMTAKQGGTVNLNPNLTSATRISDLRGPAGEITSVGTLHITVNDGSTDTTVDVDLSGAQSMGDINTAIESAIRAASPGAFSVAFPNGTGFNGGRMQLNGISAGYTITFSDGPSGQVATALGLGGHNFTTAAGTNLAAPDLNPRLTDSQPLSAMAPSSALSYGTITFRNGGRAGSITTNAGMTIGELKEAVARLNLGIRVDISASGDSLDIINEVSGFKMSIEESGGGSAASTLGLRTLDTTTPPSILNHGRGVRIADANIRPDNGNPDTARNTDFRITLRDGSTFDVDLRPQDMTTMAGILSKINADAAAAGFGAVFAAGLDPEGTGIRLSDSSVGGGALQVTSLNGHAAADLGLLDGASTSSGATSMITASNRATVRVNSLLSTLVELKQALETNSESGIQFAGERLESDLTTGLGARAEVGARAGRIADAQERLIDTTLLDQTIKSDLQDLDYIEASSRFSLLQTQLQAGLQSAAAIRSLSLINFLR